MYSQCPKRSKGLGKILRAISPSILSFLIIPNDIDWIPGRYLTPAGTTWYGIGKDRRLAADPDSDDLTPLGSRDECPKIGPCEIRIAGCAGCWAKSGSWPGAV